MKKGLLLLSLISLMALTGCGGKNGNDDTTQGDTKVIKVWVHKSSEEPEGKVYKQLQNLFNSKGLTNSKGQTLKMSMEFYGSTIETKINAAVLTNELPDVIAVDSPDVAAKANAQILVDFSKYVSAEEKASYIDSVIEEGTIDGKLYALSGMEAPAGLYYNKEILKSVGYTDADFGTLANPWSWNDVYKAQSKLKAGNKPYQIAMNLGFGTDGYMYLYSPLVYSAGETFGTDNHVTEALTTAKAVDGIKSIEKFFKKDGLQSNESWVYSGSKETCFADEDVPFEIHGPWNIRKIENDNLKVKGKYGIMPYPVYEDANGNKGSVVTPCGSYEFGVTKSSKDVESSATAVKFLTGVDASKMMYDAIGTFPTHKSLLNNDETFDTPIAKDLASYLVNNTFASRPKMVKYPRVKTAYQNIISYMKNINVVSGEYDLAKKIREEATNVDNARS